MLITLKENTCSNLLRNGYQCGLEWTGAQRVWPDDPPSQKNRLVIVPADNRQAEELFITSTRCVTIGREMSDGPMSDRYGIVCGGDDRGRAQFVLGGGKVQPDFDGTSIDRLLHAEDKELVRGAAVAENREELNIMFAEKDPSAYHRYFLFGIRRITDHASGTEQAAYVKKDGLVCADAYFLAITEERLNVFRGQSGETRGRTVMSANKLLRPQTREEREKGILQSLPAAHAIALATCIIAASEIFGEDMPAPLAEVVRDGEQEAGRVFERSFVRGHYARHITKLFQGGVWEA